jgi:hypothetical protein
MKYTSVNDAYQNVSIKSEYHLNNQYRDFPPLTNDGRNVNSSWQPGAVVNEHLIQKNNIKSNWEYRRFLVNNANQIRNELFESSLNDTGYSLRNEDPKINNLIKSPAVYGSFQDPISHRFSRESDLQNVYLSREQLYSKRIVPSVTQDVLIRNNF